MSSVSFPATVERARLRRAQQETAVYRQRFRRREVGLEYLDCGEFLLPPGSATAKLSFPGRESLLFMWRGEAVATAGGNRYELAHYDVLYVPLGVAFELANERPAPATVILTTAPAENVHPAHHARFAEVAACESRIRRLKGKDVYLMFDVSEPADKLVAGYTFFQPFQRSWPPHNHTDQEEVYFFLKGHGAMEVYDAPENLSFVVEVWEGDLVTIPMLNYHPVFSHEEPLEFMWCIAGARYWVGDRVQQFMQGGPEAITT